MAKNISSMLPQDNPEAVKIYMDLIKEMIRKEINKAPFCRLIPAVVTGVAGSTVSVKLNGDTVVISGIKNKTGETLTTNDNVYLLAINGSSLNMCALIKK
jgi:hypothetical protein